MKFNMIIAGVFVFLIIISISLVVALRPGINNNDLSGDESSNTSFITTESSESEINGGSSSRNDNSSQDDRSSADYIQRDENGIEMLVDVMPIVNAYKTGDTSLLTDKQIKTLEEAKRIISKIIVDSMSDYEKELAIHDYICLYNSYNETALNALGVYSSDDSSPYGGLVLHKSVCKGYATSFKLLCNMCGIECELIAEYEGNAIEHAYDRVSLEDSWYYVDVTWDDDEYYGNTYDTINHKYFNMTRAQFCVNHKLDNTCPDSTSEKYTYAYNNIIKVNSIDEYLDKVYTHHQARAASPLYFDLSGCGDTVLGFSGNEGAFDYYFTNDSGVERLNEPSSEILDFELSKMMVDGRVILRVEFIAS